MTVSEEVYAGNPEEHIGFILAEEAAFKRHLSGLTVPTPRGPTSLGVQFRWPNSERQIRYPYATIDLLNISPAYDLWHSVVPTTQYPSRFERPDGSVREGFYYPSVESDVQPTDPEANLWIGEYLPYRLLFQVAVRSNHILQDRYLMGKFITDVFPPRPFWVGVAADKVWRRCELLEWVTQDTVESIEDSRRIFTKIFTVSMETEIPTSQVLEIGRVRKLTVDIYDRDRAELLDTFETTEESLPSGT